MIVDGYIYLHAVTKQSKSTIDHICDDLSTQLYEATISKVNQILLKYANETSCRWLFKIGISPATYASNNQNVSKKRRRDEGTLSGRQGDGINLRMEHLVRMVDQKYLINCMVDLYRALS